MIWISISLETVILDLWFKKKKEINQDLFTRSDWLQHLNETKTRLTAEAIRDNKILSVVDLGNSNTYTYHSAC